MNTVMNENAMLEWETVIGLEVHVQLATASKIFSGSSTRFGAEPNTQANVVDLAFPGVLPVLNAAVIDKAVCLGLALDACINQKSIFARKNYFYPDLPKGYQISQMSRPIVEHGKLIIRHSGQEKTIRITRAHLEEDAGKSLHEDLHGLTGVDLNRAGIPLLEVVSEPDMRSAEEAVSYARALHSLVMWLGICDGNMQEGSFRIDANVSVRPFGQQEFGTRCEIKNLNSFRFLEAAIKYEVGRQIELIEQGEAVVQETRLYDPDDGETRSMRSKEDAHDYRYFPDPDLLPLSVTESQMDAIRASMPELPLAMNARFIEHYQLSPYDASLLTSRRDIASYFEAVVKLTGQGKLAANWVNGDIAAALNRDNKSITECPISAPRLAGLIARIVDNTISNKMAKDIFEEMWHCNDSADDMINAKGLRQITDSHAIEAIVNTVIDTSTKSVEEYRAGKEKALNALVGQVMKLSKGAANPSQVQAIIKKKLLG